MSDILRGIDRLQGQKVMVIGDIMLDHYQWGLVERISPEAPVPVVSVQREEFKLGGAGNVARNIASLGGQSLLLTSCGQDVNATKVQQLLAAENIDYFALEDSSRPTTVKTRIIASNQHVARVDHEAKNRLQGVVESRLLAYIQQYLDEYSTIIVSDYGKGVITPRILSLLELATQQQKCKVLIDPKTANFNLYHNLHIMTPNAKEAGEGAGMSLDSQQQILKAGRKIIADNKLDNLLITLGAQGMALFLGPDKIFHIPTLAQNVFDVTGAGDTVIATLALGISSGLDLLKSCILANYAAGIVVGQMGTATVESDQLRKWIRQINPPKIENWQ